MSEIDIRKHEPVGIVHPGQVFLPRAAYDRMGEDLSKLAGPNTGVTIIEPGDDSVEE